MSLKKLCISYFSHFCNNLPDKRQIKEGRAYLELQFKDIVYRDGEGMMVGT